jgi:nucleoside-diphosphate-sugar epimerase
MASVPANEGGIVLITGSSGLIGAPLMKRLAPNYKVVGLDIVEPDRLPAGAGFQEIDLSSDDAVQSAINAVRQQHGDHILSVIHLAAYYDFSGEPSEMYEQITVRGSERLLNAVKGMNVEQFVFSSTMLVHAPCPVGQQIHEESPLEPKWDYPQSKVDTEMLLLQQRGDIPLVVLRIAGVYDDTCHSIPLAHQIQRIYERQMTGKVFPGDTSCGQAMVHMDDVVDAFVRCVERRGELPPETILLIGEPETMSYDELQQAFGRLIHNESWETTQIPKAVAKTGAWFQEKLPMGEDPFIKPWMIDMADDHFELDIRRAKTMLGWEPQHRLRDTLPGMIESFKAQPAGWYARDKLELPSELKK